MEERIRICFVAFMFAPLVGGAESRAEKQARELQALGHEVMVVTPRHSKEWKRVESLDNLPVIRVGGIYHKRRLRLGKFGHLPIDILLFLKLWQLRHQYDIIHVCQIGTAAAVSALVGKLVRKPVVVSVPTTGGGEGLKDASLMADTLTTLDKDFFKVDFREAMAGDISYLSQSALGGRAMMEFLKKSEAYYQILSSRGQAYLVSHGFRAEQIVCIPNGVNTEKFRPIAERRSDPAQAERKILCVARLQYPKGIDVLLHAWARMMRESPEWRAQLQLRLLIAGEGPLQPQLERISAELGLQESVDFLGLRRDVINLLQEAWGFVLPSRWEGMPNALLEAMACGLPCVATRVSGSEDIVKNDVNALLVEPEQPGELAQALRRIIEDTPLARRLANEARATVLCDYQLSNVTEHCLNLYRRALKLETPAAHLVLEGVER